MHALLFSLALVGQAQTVLPPVPVVPPPAPAIASPAPAAATANVESLEDLKTWLLTRLIVDMSFDAKKTAEVSKMIDTLNERELRLLIAVYKEQAAKRDLFLKSQQDAAQQQTIDQARLNLQQAESYRDHLKREYDRQILQGYMTQNLNYQNLINNQRFLYQPYSFYASGPYGYSPYAYGGSYGGYNYSGVAYGLPAYGGPMIYGNPYYGGFAGRGF